MYSLTNKQIDFILNDISARGVTTEDLQLNLLDHICCIVENELEENGNFEQFYSKTILSFYKKELKELEDETQLLLTFKNYYTMKKTMFISGFFSALLLLFGGLFKIMHFPGANAMFVLGIIIFSLLFLPLMFTLKLKEKKQARERSVLIFGLVVSIFLLFGALFKMMHWPGASIIGLGSLGILLFLFVPFYLFTGIRNPETKVNTIVTSILIIAGCAFLLILPNRPKSKRLSEAEMNYLRSNEIALQELTEVLKKDSVKAQPEFDNLMKKSIDLKNVIAYGIGGVDYSKYLAEDESVRPQYLTQEALAHHKEVKEYIQALTDFENKCNTNLYVYKSLPGEENKDRYMQLEEAIMLQPNIQGIISFITLMQTRACLAVAKTGTVAVK